MPDLCPTCGRPFPAPRAAIDYGPFHPESPGPLPEPIPAAGAFALGALEAAGWVFLFVSLAWSVTLVGFGAVTGRMDMAAGCIAVYAAPPAAIGLPLVLAARWAARRRTRD